LGSGRRGSSMELLPYRVKRTTMDPLFFVLASRFVDPFILISQKGPLRGDSYSGADIFLRLKYEW
jgi:hypothetical protein